MTYKILVDMGLIFEKDGNLKYKAYFQTTGGSAYLHIKDNDKKVENEVIKVITKAMEENKYGIEQILDKNQMKKYNAYNITNYVVEAKKEYSFIDDIYGDTIVVEKNYATHGYLPRKIIIYVI